MSTSEPVLLDLPFRGTWRARNSPARRVPSHGTHRLGSTYALDFIAQRDGRPAAKRDWRTLFATEPNERFYAFDQPILAPDGGTVVAVHDGEPDHVARRSQLALVPYALGQASRVRRGSGAVAGNHVIIEIAGGGRFVVLAHLRRGSVIVRPGDAVDVGQQVAACGNSGNSTQPHLHIQVMDSPDPVTARGVPVAFRSYRAWRRPNQPSRVVPQGIPGESEIVEPL